MCTQILFCALKKYWLQNQSVKTTIIPWLTSAFPPWYFIYNTYLTQSKVSYLSFFLEVIITEYVFLILFLISILCEGTIHTLQNFRLRPLHF
jgi:hypothetical protein